MLGRVKEAVADAAETLRRTFSGVAAFRLDPGVLEARGHATALLSVQGRAGHAPPGTRLQSTPLFREAGRALAMESFRARLVEEAGWARWGTEARVVRMTPLDPARAERVAVPPLPRTARVSGGVEPPSTPQVRQAGGGLLPPKARRAEPALARPAAEEGLARILALPVPIRATDLQRLPKGLWMRYSLQMVRNTGENVRNLEVLGLFQVPRKGVADLRHDPGKGRILVRLEAAALRAPRAPFILARRKDDGVLVSCFVEDA